jgi:hypothetical protein
VPKDAEGGAGVDSDGVVNAEFGWVEYGSNVGVCSVEEGAGAGEIGAKLGAPVNGGAVAGDPKPC